MFIEATIFGNGSIVLVLLGIGMMYFSMRKQSRFLFWTGFTISHNSYFFDVEFATFTTRDYGIYPL